MTKYYITLATGIQGILETSLPLEHVVKIYPEGAIISTEAFVELPTRKEPPLEDTVVSKSVVKRLKAQKGGDES